LDGFEPAQLEVDGGAPRFARDVAQAPLELGQRFVEGPEALALDPGAALRVVAEDELRGGQPRWSIGTYSRVRSPV
jgi:hypothetical protein